VLIFAFSIVFWQNQQKKTQKKKFEKKNFEKKISKKILKKKTIFFKKNGCARVHSEKKRKKVFLTHDTISVRIED